MEFRSVADLSKLIRQSEALSAMEFDAIIGVPRSGMIPAAMIALFRNKPFADFDSFLMGRLFRHGATRPIAGSLDLRSLKRVLVIDDSVDRGTSLRKARERLSSIGIPALFGTAFKNPNYQGMLDLYLEEVSQPRIFEWNMWHSWFTSSAAFDLDGIFCRDPNNTENDDGASYQQFIRTVQPLVRPTVEVGHIVTARLEKYRPETEAWLKANGIKYGQLHMLNATAEERRRDRLHWKFKAKIYELTGAPLFIESDRWQAEEVATYTRHPVLHYATMSIVKPTRSLSAQASFRSRRLVWRAASKLRKTLGA